MWAYRSERGGFFVEDGRGRPSSIEASQLYACCISNSSSAFFLSRPQR
jgi:hypothetical protein